MRYTFALLAALLAIVLVPVSTGCGPADAAPPIIFGGGGGTSGGTGTGTGGSTNLYDTTANILAADCAVGDMARASDSEVYTFTCTATNTWTAFVGGVAVTIPPSSGWTAFNSGSVAASADGVRWLSLTAEAFAGNGFRGEYRAIPGAAWYAELGFIVPAYDDEVAAELSTAAMFTNATALEILGSQSTNFEQIRYSDFDSFSAITDSNDVQISGSVFFVRLEDDGTTNRTGALRMPDGTYSTVGTVGRTTLFTADNVGWVGNSVDLSVKVGLFHYEAGTL